MGKANLVGRLDPGAGSPKVAHQIETPRSPDPIMRRLSADREEKRVTRGTIRSGRKKQETLDLTNPNQRSLLVSSVVRGCPIVAL
jgi:hypothetical protein